MKQIFIIINILLCFFTITVNAEQHLLLEISTEDSTEGGVKVLFILEEYADARMFYYRGNRPRVVCDFVDVGVKPDLQKEIRISKKYIQNVRIGEHKTPRQKVRVVLDLVPGFDYHISQLPNQENIFSVIIKATKKSEESEESNEEIKKQDEHSKPAEDTNKEDQGDPNDEDDEEEDEDDDIIIVNNGDNHYKWPLKRDYGRIKMVAHMEIDTNGFACIKGYLVNTSDNFYYSILLDFNIYDIQDDLIGCVKGTYYNLKPGSRRVFLEHVDIKTASKFRIGDIIFW